MVSVSENLADLAREDKIISEIRASLEKGSPTLRRGGARPKSKTMSETDRTSELIDAKIAAAEARGETSLVRALGDLRGDIRELKASTAGKGTVIATAVTLFVGIAALLAAFLTFGGQWFGLGLQSGDVAQAAAQRALAAYHSQPLK